MRIERSEHSVDRGLDQVGLVHFLDILNTDALENVAKEVQLLIDIGVLLGLLREERRGDLRGHEDPGHGPGTCRHEEFFHRLRHPSSVLNQLSGSTGVLVSRISI